MQPLHGLMSRLPCSRTACRVSADGCGASLLAFREGFERCAHSVPFGRIQIVGPRGPGGHSRVSKLCGCRNRAVHRAGETPERLVKPLCLVLGVEKEVGGVVLELQRQHRRKCKRLLRWLAASSVPNRNGQTCLRTGSCARSGRRASQRIGCTPRRERIELEPDDSLAGASLSGNQVRRRFLSLRRPVSDNGGDGRLRCERNAVRPGSGAVGARYR